MLTADISPLPPRLAGLMWQPDSILAQSPLGCWTQSGRGVRSLPKSPLWCEDRVRPHQEEAKTSSPTPRRAAGGRLIGSARHCCSPNTRYVFTGWERTNTRSTPGRQKPLRADLVEVASLCLLVCQRHTFTPENSSHGTLTDSILLNSSLCKSTEWESTPHASQCRCQ